MSLESALDEYPKDIKAKDGTLGVLRPLEPEDESAFHKFFLAVPPNELMILKHRVNDASVIHNWCQNIDLGRNLPLLLVANGTVMGVGTLHQQLGGWKRHIGRVSVYIHPRHRGAGLAKILVEEVIDIARQCGLEKVEAEFIGKQEGARKLFAILGFSELVRLPDYVKDMQAITHDYILMGLDLLTDEEYAGVGG